MDPTALFSAFMAGYEGAKKEALVQSNFWPQQWNNRRYYPYGRNEECNYDGYADNRQANRTPYPQIRQRNYRGYSGKERSNNPYREELRQLHKDLNSTLKDRKYDPRLE